MKPSLTAVTALLVIIDRGITEKISKEIWPWELPVYVEKFGEGKCVVTGERVQETELPDPEEEFARLHSVFGVEEQTKQHYADMAFGRGKAGIIELGKAIKDSVAKPKKPKKVKAEKKPAEEAPKAKKEAKPKAKAPKVVDPPTNGDPLA